MHVCRQAKKAVTLSPISARAISVREELLKTNNSEDYKVSLQVSAASRKWPINFKKRYSLRSVSLIGEEVSASALTVIKEIHILKKTLREFPPERT